MIDFSNFHFQLIKSVKLETGYEDIKARLKHGFQPYISSVETVYEDIKARLKHGFQHYIFSSS